MALIPPTPRHFGHAEEILEKANCVEKLKNVITEMDLDQMI